MNACDYVYLEACPHCGSAVYRFLYVFRCNVGDCGDEFICTKVEDICVGVPTRHTLQSQTVYAPCGHLVGLFADYRGHVCTRAAFDQEIHATFLGFGGSWNIAAS